jgi:phage gp29-like protein
MEKRTPRHRSRRPAGPALIPAVASGPAASLPVALTRQITLPRLAWRGARAAHFDPVRLESVLTAALAGDHQSQWELFDLMEDTWPRLAKNMSELKRCVAAMRWRVQPWAEADAPPAAQALERAALVEHAIWRMRPEAAADERDFTGLLTDLLDAWFKGLSLSELIWEQRHSDAHGDIFVPRAAHWVHPAYYAVTETGRIALRLDPEAGRLTPAGAFYAELPPYKFLIGAARHRATHFLGAGLLRPLAWWWMAQNFAAEWQLNYAQLFGVPIRWATYAPGSAPETVAKIGEALANLGSAGWANFPEGTTLHLLEGQKTAGQSPQEAIQDRADKYCDLLILGQTLTSDPADRGTQALGTVHERIRGDVIQSAADWLASILNQQLVPALLELNYGDAEAAPELRGEPVRQKDYLAQAQRDQILLAAGVPLPRAWFYARHDVPLPQPGEDTIGGRDTPGLAPPGRPAADAAQAARAGAAGWSGEPPSDAIAAAKAAALAEAYRGALAPVRDLILQAATPEEAYDAVAAHFRDWRPEKIIALTEEALQLAAAAGAAAAARGRRQPGRITPP